MLGQGLGSSGVLVGLWLVHGQFLEGSPGVLKSHHPYIKDALGGGGSPNVLSAFPPYYTGSSSVLCADFCLSSRWIFV